MKKIIFLLLPLFAFLFGCEDMNSFHEDYIKDGETIYSVKPTSTAAFPGHNRVKIMAGFKTAPHIEQIKIDWNDGVDSQVFDVVGKNDSVSYEFTIENLNEESYMFEIYSLDSDGNRSVKNAEFASAYGDKYLATLQNRSINEISVSGSLLKLDWASSKKGETFTDLTYQNNLGKQTTIRILPEETQSIMFDCDMTQQISYSTGYLPETTSIDTFYITPTVVDINN